MAPRLTVAIPTYNRAGLLAECLETVLAQNFGDFELLVVDNCSTDETQDVVRAIADPRLRLVVNDRNLGPAGNGRRCVDLATGDYLYVMFDDDLMEPENLALKVAALDAFPSASFVCSQLITMDARGNILDGGTPHPTDPVDYVLPGHLFVERAFQRENFVGCPTVMMRRRAILAIGWHDTRSMFTADWDLWIRLAALGDMVYLARPLIRYRLHDGQDSAQYNMKVDGLRQEAANRRSAIERQAHRLADPDRFLDSAHMPQVRVALAKTGEYRESGDRHMARQYARTALHLSPKALGGLRRSGHQDLVFPPAADLRALASVSGL